MLDVDLGPESALDFITTARCRSFEGKVLIVTGGISDQEAVQLVQAGVAGILHKHHALSVRISGREGLLVYGGNRVEIGATFPTPRVFSEL